MSELLDDARTQLARRVHDLRLGAGWSAARLAADARVDPGHLRRIEAGAVDPRLSTLARLASSLGVTPAALLAPGESPGDVPSATPHRALGLALRRLRAAKGLSGAALAARAGISPQYLQRVESNRQSPTVRTLLRLAEALGVAPGALLPRG
ncbi:MAG: helix-turn-helix transcriptional regulator [Polyangiales bacterium]